MKYLWIILILAGCSSTGDEYCFPGREIDPGKEGFVCRNIPI